VKYKTDKHAIPDAEAHIAGYCLINDISERYFQLEISAGQWDKGKGGTPLARLIPGWLPPMKLRT